MSSITMNFEQAITLTGYGRFHFSLAACCAICLLSVGFQNGLTAYVLPVAKCDLELSSAQMGYLNISFLIGGICSALLWGFLGDIYGRRKLLVLTLLSDWLVTICAGLSQTFAALLTFRLLNGFLVGAPGTLIYSYLGEFQSKRHRARTICYVGMFFTFAWILLPGIAWIIIPLPWEIRYSGFVFNSWRFFIIVLSLPSLIGGVWIFSLPESPKFLLSRGENKHALAILRHIFTANTGQPAHNLQIRVLKSDVTDVNVVSDASTTIKTVGRGRTLRLFHESYNQLKILFRPKLLSVTILTSTIMFANVFGYLGLGLWLPEILNRFEEYNIHRPNSKITLCELQTYFDPELFHPTTRNESEMEAVNFTDYTDHVDEIFKCNNDIDATVFINTILMGACCLIGNVIAAYLVGILNHKVLPIATMLLGSGSAAAIYWLNTSFQHLVIASLFQATMATANMTLNSVIVDLFPTAVSAKAVCIVTLSGRLGAVVSNLVIGLLLDKSCEIPIFIVSSVLLAGGILGFFIPSTTIDKEVNKFHKSVSDISIISTM